MKALIYDKILHLADDYPKPIPKTGESLIRVLLTGLCNTDIEITKGYMGFKGVPGHEFVGIVEESANSELIGKRVVGEINCSCGECSFCRKDLRKHCPHRSVLGIEKRDGAFAQWITLPDENLHIVPDTISNEEAVFTEPLAAAFEITTGVHIQPDQRVLILGAGRLGNLCSQVIFNMGCHLTVVDKHKDKLEYITASQTIVYTPELIDRLKPFDVVIECTGSPEGFPIALRAVKPRGTIVQKSTYNSRIDFDISYLTVNEIKLAGSRCGPFRPALNALETKLIEVNPLISAIFPFEEVLTAFNAASERSSIKILVRLSDF